MALLNAHQVFFIPALTPALYRLGLIVGVMFLSPRFGIYGLAWGALIGAGLHLALQLPALLRLGGDYTPTFGLDQPAVREVAILIGPRLLGVAVVQLNFWVNTNLASQMTPGSVAALGAAFALMLMPQAALAQSVATAAMPTLAAQAALGKRAELRSTLAASVRGVLLLAAPATVGLALLAAPITALIYQRGAFDARSTELVAWALLWYGLGLLGHSVVELLARAFYALSDTRTPVLVGGLAMGLNLLFSILLTGVFERIGWLPVGGLALANSLATALEAVVLLYLMRRRLEGLEGRRILGGFAAAAAASLAMAAALLGWLAAGQALPLWLQGLVGIPLGGAVFAVAALALRIPEARQAVGLLRRRLRRNG
jgi:putative peptidoglycan lipid II flippase